MGLVALERVEHRQNVVARALLRIALAVLRDVGRRIAARVIRHATIIPGEMPDLRLPGAVIARELVDENHRKCRFRSPRNRA